MPDHRRHRGPHPEDHALFAAEAVPRLQVATHDLSWLLSRGYASASSLKLVGDRYELVTRQRLAVARCACSDSDLERRQVRQVSSADVHDQPLWIDGYNLLTSIEAALSGGVLLLGRDGCVRDMASMHGSYRKVEETVPAIELIGQALGRLRPSICHWLLDQPVSNSGRLKTMLDDMAATSNWPWQVELVPDPDAVLKDKHDIVATADSAILQGADRWLNLARDIVMTHTADKWMVNLGAMSR